MIALFDTLLLYPDSHHRFFPSIFLSFKQRGSLTHTHLQIPAQGRLHSLTFYCSFEVCSYILRIGAKLTNCQMHTFPIELCQRVFMIAHSTTARCSDRDPGNLLEIEIILSSVCRYWRRIALSTASLWAIITISPATSSIHMLHAYTSRSAPLSISVRVNLGLEGLDSNVNICHQYHHCARRVSRLYLGHGSPRHLIDLLSRISGYPHPALEIITLRSDGLSRDFQEQITFHDARRLAEIHMDGGFFNILAHHTLRHMRRIFVRQHHLKFEGDHIHDSFYRIFDGSQLEYLEIGPSYFEFWPHTTSTTLPNLKTLVIPRMMLHILFQFFEAIHAPNLQTIAISISLNTESQYCHPSWQNLPVDPLHMYYEALELQTNFQVPDSVRNVFSSVHNLGLLGAAMEISSRILSTTLCRFACIFPNVVSLHTDINMSTLRSTFAASSQLIFADLRYVYCLHISRIVIVLKSLDRVPRQSQAIFWSRHVFA